jgi:hypothetical protein
MAPFGWAVVIGDTAFYLYFATKSHYDPVNIFLVWDIIMVPIALMYTAALARRYNRHRPEPEEPKQYVRISKEE